MHFLEVYFKGKYVCFLSFLHFGSPVWYYSCEFLSPEASWASPITVHLLSPLAIQFWSSYIVCLFHSTELLSSQWYFHSKDMGQTTSYNSSTFGCAMLECVIAQ